jgi:ABC-2 type transport system permease protein
MATTSTTIQQPISTPRKRSRGLAITLRSLSATKVILSSIAFYAFFITIIVGAIYPTISKAINLNAYMGSSIVSGLVGTNLKTYSTFPALLAIELYGSFYPIIFGGAIAYIAGAALPTMIENGTIDLALARPISRTRYFLEMLFSAFLAGLVTSLVTLLAVWVSTFFVKDNGLNWNWVVIAQLIETAFFCFAIGVGMMFGSFLNSGRAAGGATLGIIGLGYLISLVGTLSSNLDWLQRIGPFYYAKGGEALVNHTITIWYPLVLLGAGVICALVGLIIFNRRDLPSI